MAAAAEEGLVAPLAEAQKDVAEVAVEPCLGHVFLLMLSHQPWMLLLGQKPLMPPQPT
jgi:hypothetical protein